MTLINGDIETESLGNTNSCCNLIRLSNGNSEEKKMTKELSKQK